jgi:hypothetical protein
MFAKIGSIVKATVPVPVCVEFQFRRELGSEISRGNVAAKYMTQV